MSRRSLGLLLLLAAFSAALALRYLAGSSGFGAPHPSVERYRLDSGLAATAAGVALAMAGLFLQVLLRNPLASPFVLGLSSGAGFGYMFALYLGWLGWLGWLGISSESGVGAAASALGLTTPVLFATLGAFLTLGIVWRIGVRRGAVDPLALVLAGVIVGSIFSAGSAALQSLVPAGLRGDFVLWMMGRVPEAPPQRLLLVVSALAVTGAGLGIALGRSLDAACLSDDEARSVGVPLGWLRVTLFLAAGILTAATVSLTGPIAFVGLVAPHAARLLVGPRHATLALGSALAGAALLLAADSARQLLEIGGGRLPVGVLTAVIGGPVFLLLLRRAPILRQQGAT